MAGLKQQVGRLIPYPLIRAGRKLLHFGPDRCPVCGSGTRALQDSGYGFAVLEQLQVVGGLMRRADRCPICHSSARERLQWFWLNRKGSGLRPAPGTRIAHFAPEKGLSEQLLAAFPATYVPYDFEPSRYRHLSGVRKGDLSALAIADASVDLLICNHVLEHVPDVALALSEIRRVLAPGGMALLQVPLALNLPASIELGMGSSPAERIARTGQDDHVRLFNADDYFKVLQAAGFAVERYDAFADDAETATAWQLDPFERLHICHRGD